jgi:hypothetical protein
MSQQLKLALLTARVGSQQYTNWGLTGPLTNVQHHHDNRTIVGGNQYNVTSSGSGNVSVGNVTNNQQAGGGGSSKRHLSNKVGSPSRRRHKHEDNTNYSTHYSNNNRPHSKELTEAQELLARGFVINNGESLKKLKELLIEYDKKRYDEANIAPATNTDGLPPAIPPPVIAPPVIVPINNCGSCWCRKPDNNDMIFCTFDRCPHGWFHFKCLNLKREEADQLPDDWICTFCTD